MVRFLPSLLLTIAAAGFAWLFFTRYWLYRDCIAEAASSCIALDGSNLIEGGAIWIVPAIGLLILALALWPWRRKG